MAQATVTVTGAARLRKTMRAAGDDLADLKTANLKAGQVVADWAGLTAPRRSGALGASVRASKRAGGAQVLAGRAQVPYAGPIHWGWPARHIRAQPWIEAAARSTEPTWLADYQRDIDAVIARVKGA